MASVRVTTREGATNAISASEGLSLMEVIRDAGIDELLAICGGSCSCSTCHIYVDADMLAALPPIGPDEDDLLESSDHRTERSRLACQVPFTAALDGIAVTIAPED